MSVMGFSYTILNITLIIRDPEERGGKRGGKRSGKMRERNGDIVRVRDRA